MIDTKPEHKNSAQESCLQDCIQHSGYPGIHQERHRK